MTLTRSIISASLILCGIASAGVPVKRPAQAYKHLDGLMTSQRTVIPDSVLNPLADWRLTGVSELEGGYLVTLSHRKNSSEQMVLRPSSGTGFKVQRVEFADDWRKLVVHLNCNGTAATIRFDEQLPVPAAPARAVVEQPAGRPRGAKAPTSPVSPVSAPAR